MTAALALALLLALATALALGLGNRRRLRGFAAELRRYRDVADIASDWLWEIDAERRFTFLSERFTEAAGIPAATIIGRGLGASSGVRLEPEEAAELDQILAAREPFQRLVNRVTLPDGRTRYWRASGKPCVDVRSGAFLGYRGVASDVTDMALREEAVTRALRRAEAAEDAAHWARIRLLDAIDVVPAGFALWDGEDHLVLCNARYRELYYKLSDLLVPGVDFAETVRAGVERGQYRLGDETPEHWVAERIAKHRAGSRFERRLADGRWIQIDERRTVDGGIVSIHVDVSEARQREATEHERQKLAALGQLAGGVAHEINNLLQPAITFPGLVSERLPADDVESREDLAMVLESARKARDIVRSILTFSRKEEPKLAPLELAAEVDAAMRFVRDLLPPSVTIAVQPVDGIAGARVAADRTQLTQVLTNLIVNATHAMKDRGTITVALARRQPARSEAAKLGIDPALRYLTVAVTDTGCGMDDATQARIFEPFFTTKPVGQGTGLGLSVVYAILQGWGGSIAVKSAPGRGATFTLYLPELPAEAVAAPAASTPAAG